MCGVLRTQGSWHNRTAKLDLSQPIITWEGTTHCLKLCCLETRLHLPVYPRTPPSRGISPPRIKMLKGAATWTAFCTDDAGPASYILTQKHTPRRSTSPRTLNPMGLLSTCTGHSSPVRCRGGKASPWQAHQEMKDRSPAKKEGVGCIPSPGGGKDPRGVVPGTAAQLLGSPQINKKPVDFHKINFSEGKKG